MQIYQSSLTLRSASGSRWLADTIFGHLCWYLIRQHDEAYLTLFLAQYEQGAPPFLLSDGFPGALLPRPLLPRFEALSALTKQERIQRLTERKQTAQAQWLSLAAFNRLRCGESLSPGDLPDTNEIHQQTRLHTTPKNQVDRLTNTTGGNGGELFDFEEYVLPKVTIYWRIADGYEELVRKFLADLQASGYGKRKSVGYGQIAHFTLEKFDGFTDVPNANGFMSLARFVPQPDDPTDGYWSTAVKYGKLGEEFAVGGNPFKKPLIQLECGSCFRDAKQQDWQRRWYGQLLSNIAPHHPAIKQYAFAFLVPIVMT